MVDEQKMVGEEDLYEISTHNFDHTLSNHQKAQYHFLRGRLLNIFDSYNVRSEENLIVSVKLNPRNFLAWTELGECYWKKGDLKAAEECFKWILGIEKDKQALTNLAMIKRRANKGI
jgi:tetratricopeptide (TPR) repeat protein